VFTPINQAIYPRISHKFDVRFSDGVALAKKALRWQGGIGIAITAVILASSHLVIPILFGDAYMPAVSVLRWLAPIPLFLGLAGVFANLILLPLRYDATHVRMVMSAAALNVAIIVPLSASWGASGAAIAVSVTELFVLCFSFVYARKALSCAVRLEHQS